VSTLLPMSRTTKAYLSLVYICIAWGTTYLAIRVGVEHYPAFLFAGIRQFVAGIILLAVALIANGSPDLTRKNLGRQALLGLLMLTFGNGGVTWGEKYISSGVAALLCAMMPIFAVLFNLASSSRDKLNLPIAFGMIVGLGGVALIFKQNIHDIGRPEYLAGILCTLFATASWAFGSTLSKRYGKAKNPMANAALQLFFGGLFMLLISPVADNYTGFDPLNRPALLALAYLVLFGSVAAYAAYMFVLEVLPVGVATIYAYVNPLIAVLAGAAFLGELLDVYIGLAFAAIVGSVVLVKYGYARQHKESIKAGSSSVALPAES
jgi:drug/metabolite transporter (DMT)-like permease